MHNSYENLQQTLKTIEIRYNFDRTIVQKISENPRIFEPTI